MAKRESVEMKALRRLDILGAAVESWEPEVRRAYDYLTRVISKYAPKEEARRGK